MKGRITLTGISVNASHGVYGFEKTGVHPFVADAVLYTDKMCGSDNLCRTYDYSKAAEIIAGELGGKSVDLIETLATRIAKKLSIAFNADCDVTVHKPEAPLNVNFSDVSVTAHSRFTRVCLGLGSNMGDRKKYLDDAVAAIKADEENKDVRVSSYHATAPYGGAAHGEFLNACLVMRTLKDPFALLDMCAALESAAGRVRKERWGDRTLDADILLYGQEVIDEEGLIVPHVGICEREFVLAPLSEIAPGTVHPVCGATVAQLYAAYKEKNR